MNDYLVRYNCTRLDILVLRTVRETDAVNAVLAARREERRLTSTCCTECVLLDVARTV